jgi:GH25 family lysozyme M1 (1,4-beta-N-acetylmuramidase)
MPVNFNNIINLPSGCAQGVDVSHYNTNVDWAALAVAGVTFAYIKISDGIGTPDLTAAQHAADARANGLQIGYYHFCRPKTRGGTVEQAAVAEANDTANVMAGLPAANLPLVMDLEQTNPDSPLSPGDYLLWVNSYIGALPAGTNVMIYTYKSYIDTKLPADHNLGQYPLWLARYITDYGQAQCPAGWDCWKMWQFSESGSIGGNAKIDLNVMQPDTNIA